MMKTVLIIYLFAISLCYSEINYEIGSLDFANYMYVGLLSTDGNVYLLKSEKTEFNDIFRSIIKIDRDGILLNEYNLNCGTIRVATKVKCDTNGGILIAGDVMSDCIDIFKELPSHEDINTSETGFITRINNKGIIDIQKIGGYCESNVLELNIPKNSVLFRSAKFMKKPDYQFEEGLNSIGKFDSTGYLSWNFTFDKEISTNDTKILLLGDSRENTYVGITPYCDVTELFGEKVELSEDFMFWVAKIAPEGKISWLISPVTDYECYLHKGFTNKDDEIIFLGGFGVDLKLGDKEIKEIEVKEKDYHSYTQLFITKIDSTGKCLMLKTLFASYDKDEPDLEIKSIFNNEGIEEIILYGYFCEDVIINDKKIIPDFRKQYMEIGLNDKGEILWAEKDISYPKSDNFIERKISVNSKNEAVIIDQFYKDKEKKTGYIEVKSVNFPLLKPE